MIATTRLATAVLGAALLLALGACRANVDCESDADCGEDERCRLEVAACPGHPTAVSSRGGECRDFGSACASDADCVPEERCDADGICRPPQVPICTSPPSSCPPGCTLVAPYPCACVCEACPAA